jgi:hypothetical protein
MGPLLLRASTQEMFQTALGDPNAHLEIEAVCHGQWFISTVHWVLFQLSALTAVSGPVNYSMCFLPLPGEHSHAAACLAVSVDNTQSQALSGLFITRLETRTKESAGHACEESYCKRLC